MSNSKIVHKAYKFRIYPTDEQKVLIHKTIGCSRFVFNNYLASWNDTYEKTGVGLTYNSCSKDLTQLKKSLDWLKEVDSVALQSSLKNLADAFTRFFKKQNKRLFAENFDRYYRKPRYYWYRRLKSQFYA